MTTRQHGVRSEQTVQLLDALSRLIRTSRAVNHRQHGEYGLSGTPLGILKALARGDARAGDLAIQLQVAPSVVSRAVTPLEQSGLVERRVDPADARAVRLGLTAAGQHRLDDARGSFADRFTPLLDDWDSAELAALTRLMDRLESTIADGFGARGGDHPTADQRVVTS